MATYSYPANADLRLVAEEYVSLLTNTDNVMVDPIFRHFGIRNVDADTVIWEQGTNIFGLQQYRGAGGEYPPIPKQGVNRYVITPGYYGEKEVISETDILRLRRTGDFAAPIDIGGLIAAATRRLVQREIDRMRSIAWTLATTATFTVLGPDGVNAVHTDTYSTQSITFSTWANTSTATPLADLRRLKILQRGSGVRFDRTSYMYANQVTINYLMNNTNTNDIGGKRVIAVGGTESVTLTNNLAQINGILLDNDLPQIVPYDDGYLTSPDPNSFTPFIADNRLVVFGARVDGEPIAYFEQTLNAETMMPGPDINVVETSNPKNVSVYRGVNYAPTIQHPRSIVWATT